MILNFLAPSIDRPVGGVAVIYEFAQAMAARGHTVRLFHIHDAPWKDRSSDEEGAKQHFRGLDEISWFQFTSEIEHFFVAHDADPATVPDADIFFGHSPVIDENPRLGLPVALVQGYQMLDAETEDANFRANCPKICVASWLTRVARSRDVPDRELVHVPIGLDERMALTNPIAHRPRQLTFCYNPHPNKGSKVAIAAVEEVHRQRPDVHVVAFGSTPAPETLPEYVEYFERPDRSFLINQIYNRSAIFLWSSVVEGFGLPPLEAMACGAALVTTDNGGSEDYTFPDRTALVAPTGDIAALAEKVVELFDAETTRARLATAGQAHAATFTWARSAETLERFLEDYLADPAAFGRP